MREMHATTRIQEEFCDQRKVNCLPSPPEDIVGLAKSTLTMPIANGLRNHPTPGTTGWYVWFGETFSQQDDFFTPVHARHLYEDQPELTRLLGLPPGYRFLLAGDYLDIWFDENLLVSEGNES